MKLMFQFVVVAVSLIVGTLNADKPAGPLIGTELPEFSIPDHDGKMRAWHQLQKAGPTALVFHRSADW